MAFKQTDLIAVFGKRESGKSTLGKKLGRAFPRVVIIDVVRDYDPSEADFLVSSPAQLAETLILCREQNYRQFRILYHFPLNLMADDDADLEREIQEFSLLIRLLHRFGDLVVVIEEIHLFMRNEWMPTALKRLVLLGRHSRVGILATSQKPAYVSKGFVSQCAHVFVTTMFEANDLEYFRRTIGDAAETLKNLPRFSFLHWRDNGARPAIVKNR